MSHSKSSSSNTDKVSGEAITHLLEKGFQPKRTLILSHGFDEEEVFARRGQGHIAPFLEERYGNDGLLMVIDEGFGTSDNVSRLAGLFCFVTDSVQWHDAPFALPATGEKGYLDIKVSYLVQQTSECV